MRLTRANMKNIVLKSEAVIKIHAFHNYKFACQTSIYKNTSLLETCYITDECKKNDSRQISRQIVTKLTKC